MMAHACSLELPSTGAGFTSAFDAQIELFSVDAGASDSRGSAHQPDDVAGGLNPSSRDAQIPTLPDGALADPSDARDSAVSTTTADAATSADAAVTQGSSCVLDGRFAMRLLFAVTWVGTEFASIVPVINSGEGELSITGFMELKSTPDGLQNSFRTCASEVPEFVAALSREHYQARFADQVWDAPSMPVYSAALSTSCRQPRCSVLGEPLYELLGVQLPSRLAPWPREVGSAVWPDHDGDGEPGIAVSMAGPEDGAYAYPPLDLVSYRRVHALSLGLRVIVGLSGTLDSCDALHGVTREASVETRAVACHGLQTQGQMQAQTPTQCEPRELEFLNQNLPVWTVSQGSFQARRLARDADCRAVRRTFGRAPSTKSDNP